MPAASILEQTPLGHNGAPAAAGLQIQIAEMEKQRGMSQGPTEMEKQHGMSQGPTITQTQRGTAEQDEPRPHWRANPITYAPKRSCNGNAMPL